MQTFKSITLGIFFMLSISALADNSPLLTSMTIGKTYIPDGFDDNDNVQLVAEGYFPNSCYRPAPSNRSIDLKKKEITLSPMAFKYDGVCLMVILPFEISFQLGPLKKGAYSIKQPDGTLLGTLNVGRSTKSEPDDFLYAPISQAFLSETTASSSVHLTGDFPLSCMRMKEVRYQIQSDVILIQPIAEVDSSLTCVSGSYAFSAQVNLGTVKTGKYLLHVRSMNGKSVNNLVSVR